MFYDKSLAKVKSFYFQKIRDFFNERGFLEVEIPIMTPEVDPEPNLTPFETTLKNPFEASAQYGKEIPMYLVPSPEFSMKKLLGAGFGNIYTLTKVFRNGELGGGRHNPEFTMLEWYREKADYTDIMKDTEELVNYLAKAFNEKFGKELEGKSFAGKIDLNLSWERKSLNQLFIENCGIDLLKNKDFETFKKTASDKGYDTNNCVIWDDILYKIFLNKIEPELGFGKPVIVYDYPATQRALAKRKKSEPFWVERFEAYIAGKELCNAFSELLDSDEQRKRFEEDLETRRKMGKTIFPVDEEFLTSLKSIRHPCGGNALGVDRLLQVLLDKPRVEDVMLFPMSGMLEE